MAMSSAPNKKSAFQRSHVKFGSGPISQLACSPTGVLIIRSGVDYDFGALGGIVCANLPCSSRPAETTSSGQPTCHSQNNSARKELSSNDSPPPEIRELQLWSVAMVRKDKADGSRRCRCGRSRSTQHHHNRCYVLLRLHPSTPISRTLIVMPLSSLVRIARCNFAIVQGDL